MSTYPFELRVPRRIQAALAMLESVNRLVRWMYCKSLRRFCAARASVEDPLTVLDLRRDGDVLLETPQCTPLARGRARA